MVINLDEHINSVLLCTNADEKSEKDKLKIIQFLLYKYKDKKELLSKLKILATNKEINFCYNRKLYKQECIEDKIIKCVSIFLGHEDFCFPDDFIKLLRKNDKEYKYIVNWFFNECECKKSDKIIKQIINNLFEHPESEINNSYNPIAPTNEVVNIKTIDINVLKAFDAQIEKQFKANQININEMKMLFNRSICIIKTIITKNCTRNIRLYKILHDSDLATIEIIKVYFKNLKVSDIKKFHRKYIKYLKNDPSLLIYINKIVSFCLKKNYKFNWKRVLKIFSKDNRFTDFDVIDCKNIPCGVFYRFLNECDDANKFRKLAKKVINTDYDTDLLEKYIKLYNENDNLAYYKLLMVKRIEKLKKQ